MSSERIFIGRELPFCYDLADALDKTFSEKLSAVIAPLFHPRVMTMTFPTPVTDPDLSHRVRLGSEKAFKQEIAWATHLSVPSVVLPTPSRECTNYARVLQQCVTQAQYLQFWVRVPLNTAGSRRSTGGDSTETPDNGMDTSPWTHWNALRTMCEFHPKVGVALEITADLPSPEELARWLGEPIRAVLVPTDIFLTNRKGYPTLSQRHQRFFLELFRFPGIQFFLKGRPRHHERLLPYVQYLHYLFSKRPAMDAKALFEAPYLDYLQAPLQPLMDNLESQTYETFEQDNFKYDQYEKAITCALLATPKEKESVIMVVGAGRGPLVRCALRASVTAQRRTRLYAVEKNPNAVITLRNLKISEKWDNVTVIASDMRHWRAVEKADIMVSELLGSFSDNELSPECLDGAQAFLKEDGVSIPCKYTSYVAPIMSSKLWNDVKALDGLKHFETPYVVRLHNVYSIASPQACFTFQHPKFATRIDNRRQQDMIFQAEADAVVHGFAGYFDAVLYGDVTLSIHPETHSDGMFSWFPIYFPLRQPLSIFQGESMRVSFWRMVGGNKVWYEWAVAVSGGHVRSPIHNPNGRSYWIGL
ncbi:hypothetical protein ATCC90586_004138 [Pythium insidiosum]|nr:hypothetical protein ATCC90586_004138 [Pythium insidiosum]